VLGPFPDFTGISEKVDTSINCGGGLLGRQFWGAMQVGAYWIIVWALALAPMGKVSALRETSVLFVALISTFILREGF